MIYDYPLMFVTDDRITNDETFFIVLESSLKGGVSCIQLREKNCNTYGFYRRAIRAKALCEAYKVPLIINDRIDIALAVNADGVHLGRQDMPYGVAKNLLGKNKMIGLSVDTREQVMESTALDVAYLSISPVFATHTKTSDIASPLGIEGLKNMRKVSSKPLICIGGIHADNVSELIKNGSDGVAVVSAISMAHNPEQATKQLREVICQATLKT